MNKEIKVAKEAALDAGNLILSFYKADYEIRDKGYHNPVTTADHAADNRIKEILVQSFPEYGWLSEETEDSKDRLENERVWVVDPLDGTKEFVKRNGEFTVNIAMIHNGIPIIGVIYTPVSQELYFAMEPYGSFKINRPLQINSLDNLITESDKLPIDYKRNNYVIVGSRSHMSEETEKFIEDKKKEHKKVKMLIVGSSLKFCIIAEGKADAYPRYALTMEWDTGAGHAIAKMAGFSTLQYDTKEELSYNKQNLLNPWFLVN